MTDQPGAGPPAGGSPMSERMQALLSRAVEDQVSEQRQIQALLGEIRTMVSQLPAQVAAATPQRPTDDAGGEHIRARLDDLAGRITLLSQRIDALSTSAENRAQDDTSLLAVVGAVQSATDSVISRLDTLGQSIDDESSRSSAAEAAQSGAEIGPRLAAVEGRLSEFTSALAEVTVRLSGIGNVVGSIPEDVRALSERVESRLGNRLDRLDEIAAAVATLQSAPGADDGSKQELVEIRGALQALNERPTLSEDRESVVLAVQQVLGESVRTTVNESAAQTERRILDSVRTTVNESTTESEQRVLEHVDAAVIALAEALLKRRSSPVRPGVAEPPAVTEIPGVAETAAEPAAVTESPATAGTPARPFSPAPVAVSPNEPETEPDSAPSSAAREALSELADEAPPEPDSPDTSSQAYFARVTPAHEDGDGEPASAPPGLAGDVVSENEGPQEGDDASEDMGRRRRAWWRPGE